MRFAIILSALLAVFASGGFSPHSAAAQEAWEITSYDVSYVIQPDGSIDAKETIYVDWLGLQRRGIERYFFPRVDCPPPITGADRPLNPCPAGADRKYDYDIHSVTRLDGSAWKFSTETIDGRLRIRVGDEDTFLTGRHEYVISYTVKGALDAYAEHDELYWDVTGTWPVPIQQFTMSVSLPAGADPMTICYTGYSGSTEQCFASAEGNVAEFATTRPMSPFEQVTVAVGWEKGLVDVPLPLVVEQATIDDFFTLDAQEWAGLAFSFLAGVGIVLWGWWTHGRDKSYTSVYYLTNNPEEYTRPLFTRDEVVVEYLPPEDLKPAQMGVILDERADTLDVTATIVDLAVRGYLHITELPKQGWFGSNDWKLTKLKETEGLTPFEKEIFTGLFAGAATEVDLSDLKYKFADDLAKAKELLYKDAMKQKWFEVKPETAKGMWIVVGIAMLILGIGLSILSATYWARGLAFAGLIPAAIVMLVMSRSMSRRTAKGSEVLRRVLGFRLYIDTAEKHMQEFNEQENIFARYLPYAIVFGSVRKWAKAFEGIEAQAQQATQSWYTGVGAFHVASFSSGLQSFNSSVSSTLASTQSSSGGSGFSGGSSGGGGGGGGGGSW